MVWDTLRSLHQQHYFTSRYEGGNKAGMGVSFCLFLYMGSDRNNTVDIV